MRGLLGLLNIEECKCPCETGPRLKRRSWTAFSPCLSLLTKPMNNSKASYISSPPEARLSCRLLFEPKCQWSLLGGGRCRPPAGAGLETRLPVPGGTHMASAQKQRGVALSGRDRLLGAFQAPGLPACWAGLPRTPGIRVFPPVDVKACRDLPGWPDRGSPREPLPISGPWHPHSGWSLTLRGVPLLLSPHAAGGSLLLWGSEWRPPPWGNWWGGEGCGPLPPRTQRPSSGRTDFREDPAVQEFPWGGLGG